MGGLTAVSEVIKLRNTIELLSALSEGMFLPAWSISWNYYLNLECQFRAPLSKPI